MAGLTRKRILLASIAVIACTVAWLAFAPRGIPPFGVTRSAYQEIRLGMTIEDVERIIGQPVGRFDIWVLFDEANPFGGPSGERESDENLRSEVHKFLEWYGDETALGVSLNQEGLVWKKWFYSPPMLARLSRQLRSFWGKLGF